MKLEREARYACPFAIALLPRKVGQEVCHVLSVLDLTQ